MGLVSICFMGGVCFGGLGRVGGVVVRFVGMRFIMGRGKEITVGGIFENKVITALK